MIYRFIFSFILCLVLVGCSGQKDTTDVKAKHFWSSDTGAYTDDSLNYLSVPNLPNVTNSGVNTVDGNTLIGGIEHYRQETDYWCGPTSVQMVFGYYGIEMSQSEIASSPPKNPIYPGRNKGGARYAPMVALAKQKGLAGTRIIDGDSFDALISRVKEGRPQIVSIGPVPRGSKSGGIINYPASLNSHRLETDFVRKTGGHVVVVKGVTRDGNIVINDPGMSNGENLVMRRENFMKIWRRMAVDMKK